MEVYKEEIGDLIGGGSGLKIREDKREGVYVEGLSECMVKNKE